MDVDSGPATPSHPARRAWTIIEALHAVTYFAPEARRAASEAGLRGFWMGYFAQRCAPLGPVGADLATAVCFGFSPRRVAHALPDAWDHVSPAEALRVRRTAAATALRERVETVEPLAAQVIPLLSSVVRSARGGGRPLFSTNRAIDLPDDPVEALWQTTTTLREHRGDGHVAALVSHGVGPIEAHLLATDDPEDRELRRDSRGWTPEDWESAAAALRERGLLDDGVVSAEGRALRDRVEAATDIAAWDPWTTGLTPEGIELLLRILRPVADAVWASGIIPTPNPMGVTRP